MHLDLVWEKGKENKKKKWVRYITDVSQRKCIKSQLVYNWADQPFLKSAAFGQTLIFLYVSLLFEKAKDCVFLLNIYSQNLKNKVNHV